MTGLHPGIHIHQGGTVLTYCGMRTEGRRAVSWESASESDCGICRSHFEVEIAAEIAREVSINPPPPPETFATIPCEEV